MILPEHMRRPECACCGSSRVDALCDWATTRYVITPVRLIEVGDRVRRSSAGPHAKTYAVVVSIDRRMHCSVNKYWFTLKVIRPKGSNDAHERILAGYTPLGKMLALRTVPCGQPVCAECLREVGEDRHYCVAHWNSWEAAA